MSCELSSWPVKLTKSRWFTQNSSICCHPRHKSGHFCRCLLLALRILTTRLAESLRGDVLPELGTHHAGVAVCAPDLAPHNAELGILDFLLRLVNVRDLLAKVPSGVLAGAHTVELQQCAVRVGVGLATLVAEDDSLRIQAHWLNGLLDRLLFAHTGGQLLLLTSHCCCLHS